MRNYTSNIRLSAVLVAPLLLACGSDGAGGGGGTSYVKTPTCTGSGQVLSTDTTGQLVCKALPAGAVSLPACAPNTQALTADGTTPSCDNLNTVDATTKTALDTLTMIESTLIDYGTKLNTLGTAGASRQATYVGLSSALVTGRITSGNLVGIPAASALCAADYGANAHMCTVYELYYSVATSNPKLKAGTDIFPGGWAYMQSWRYAPAAPAEPNAGLADNCGGYTYTYTNSDTNQWNGTTFQWTANLSKVRVPKFAANTLCNISQPIACCL